ncbi:hypothetical protein BLNAU_4415 [Blattamonas nauphoetae]|uniref:Uncharacterized protein n=1 Tax=Blattamonas nauphoetae TaxID=2049346 RepID=A0ABQ9Y9V7_9EUKA|nr:hypothetical protein BLNAU_4415 [Blattamonas nauphoetae]
MSSCGMSSSSQNALLKKYVQYASNAVSSTHGNSLVSTTNDLTGSLWRNHRSRQDDRAFEDEARVLERKRLAERRSKTSHVENQAKFISSIRNPDEPGASTFMPRSGLVDHPSQTGKTHQTSYGFQNGLPRRPMTATGHITRHTGDVHVQFSSVPSTLPKPRNSEKTREIALVPSSQKSRTLSRTSPGNVTRKPQLDLPEDAYPHLTSHQTQFESHPHDFVPYAQSSKFNASFGGDLRNSSTFQGTSDPDVALQAVAGKTTVHLSASQLDDADPFLARSSRYTQRPRSAFPSTVFSRGKNTETIKLIQGQKELSFDPSRLTSSTILLPVHTSTQANIFRKDLEGERRKERVQSAAARIEKEENELDKARVIIRRRNQLEQRQAKRYQAFQRSLLLNEPHTINQVMRASQEIKPEKSQTSTKPAPTAVTRLQLSVKTHTDEESQTGQTIAERENEEQEEEAFNTFIHRKYLTRPMRSSAYTGQLHITPQPKQFCKTDRRPMRVVSGELVNKPRVAEDGFSSVTERLNYFRTSRMNREKEEAMKRERAVLEKKQKELDDLANLKRMQMIEEEGRLSDQAQLRDDKQREKEEEEKKRKEDDEFNRKLEQQQLEVKMRRQLEEEAKRKETEEILAKLQRRNEELMRSEDELRRMRLEDVNCTITNARHRFLDELSSEASLGTFSPSSLRKQSHRLVTHTSGSTSPVSEPISTRPSTAPRHGLGIMSTSASVVSIELDEEVEEMGSGDR